MKTIISMSIDTTLIEDIYSIIAIMPEFKNRSAFFEKAAYEKLQQIKAKEADLNAKLQEGLDSPLSGNDTTDILNRVRAEKQGG